MAKITARCPILLAVVLLAGCASKAPAPVVERGGAQKAQPATPAAAPARTGEFHVVKKGETLYSIALEHGQSYRDVAAWNNIDNPNRIRVGQELRVAPPESVAVASPVVAAPVVEVRPAGDVAAKSSDRLKREPKGGKQPYSEQAMAALQRPEPPQPSAPVQAAAAPKAAETTEAAAADEDAWAWPSAGRLLAAFEEGGNKGVDIEGRIGDPVLAAEAGKVTYAGSGIRGYGNLLIIQHANGLSSVYAHNSRLLAKEGQQVARGQKIAELGSSDSDQAKLHFEIRRQGKPLDPLKLLPPR
ncbi:MAG TPA: peptidoglycan DD-metalloendopeptidase family protein [Candidatus Desulfobacillus sp.]|nr:peptidoglycan DD-metalloendopeptidase family protein [Candidatus Desulfobacillus sp.]